MRKNGHLAFAIGVALVVLYVLKQEFEIIVPLGIILWHTPTYLMGSIFVDKIEGPRSFYGLWGGGGIFHRRLLHSRRMLFATIFLIIPLTIYLGMTNSPYYFFATSFFGGHLTHLIADSSTKKLSW